MKRIFTFLVLMVSLACINATAQAQFKFEKDTHDFGVINGSDLITAIFIVENTGTEPLVINKVTVSSVKITSDYTKKPIEPGAKGEIRITYDVKGQPKGPFKKGIFVSTNAPKPKARLYIKGQIAKD